MQWTAGWFRQQWPQIIQAIGGPIGGMLGLVRPADAAPGRLRLLTPAEQFQRINSPAWSEKIERALATQLGGRVELVFTLDEKTELPPTPRRQGVTSADYNRVAEDPAVRQLMELFDASIVDVRPAALPPEMAAGDGEAESDAGASAATYSPEAGEGLAPDDDEL